MDIETAQYGKNMKPVGVAPAIGLIDPKHPHNVGAIVRSASCFGIKQVWYTGDRVPLTPHKGYRLPREERMKGYQDVELRQYERFFDQFGRDVTPVAIELRKGSETLPEFNHPDRALYVFGPEDGSLTRKITKHCHRFVVIPSRHCLNLATAVGVVLYDRAYKRWQAGLEDLPTLAEHRGPIVDPDEIHGKQIYEA